MNKEYPIFIKWYKTLDLILDKCEKYPKSVRFTFSSRIANISLDTLEQIIEVIYSKNRIPLLQKVNLNLEKLRVLFRISFERHYLSEKQYEYIATEINETGKMAGGWIKIC